MAEVACVDICILGSLGGDTEALWLLFLLFAHLAFPGVLECGPAGSQGRLPWGVSVCAIVPNGFR